MTLIVNIFRVLSTITSAMMSLSLTPTIYRIHKTHKTGHLSIFPLISMFFNSYLWLIYGYLEEIFFPVVTTSVIGLVLSFLYIVIFYRWTTNHTKAHRLFALFGCLTFLITIYIIVGVAGRTGQTPTQVGNVVGFIGIVSGLVMYTSPLEKVKLVFRHKSAVFIPIHMVGMGVVNNTMWITYASLTSRWLILTPNIITVAAGFFQVVLYFLVYHPKSHPYNDKALQRRSTATTDEDDTESGESASPTPSSIEENTCDAESGEYVTIQTPTGAHASLEMLV